MKSIGSCKFLRDSSRRGIFLNGEFSYLMLHSGTSNPNDTCVSFSNSSDNYFIPWASLYCDADNYVTLKTIPSGSCLYGGKKVEMGVPFTHETNPWQYSLLRFGGADGVASPEMMHHDVRAEVGLLEIFKGRKGKKR